MIESILPAESLSASPAARLPWSCAVCLARCLPAPSTSYSIQQHHQESICQTLKRWTKFPMSCMQTKISPPSSSWERAEGLVSNLCGNSWSGESASSPPSGAIVGHASVLWSQAGSDHGRCQMYICDMLSEASIVVRLAPFGDLLGYSCVDLR